MINNNNIIINDEGLCCTKELAALSFGGLPGYARVAQKTTLVAGKATRQRL